MRGPETYARGPERARWRALGVAMSLYVAHAARIIRRIIGVPDYEGYVAHMRTRHPGMPVLAPDEFARQCMRDRYNRPGSRCC